MTDDEPESRRVQRRPRNPVAASLDTTTIAVLKRAVSTLGFTKTYRACIVGEKTMLRALDGFAIMPLSRAKLEAFADRYRREHE